MSYARIPPIQCLVTFEALTRLRSASKTSDELCVTISAVSHRIKQLEDHLGFKLFGRDFTLTVEGAAYLAHVKTGLTALEQMTQRAPDSTRPRVRIAMPPTFCRQLLMPLLEHFRLTYPDIDLVLDVAIPLIDTRDESVDFEVRFGLGGYTDREFQRIQSDTLTPVCSPQFIRENGPFEGFHTQRELTQTRLIRSPLEPWAPWFQHCGWPALEEPQGSQFNDLGLAYDAAAAGLGVVLLRQRLGAAWLASGKLVRLSPQSVPGPYSYYLCYRPAALQRWECTTFADWLSTSLADSPDNQPSLSI